ncbi:hypothetical protein M5K25_019483 [Dendrobium thyrsiflorum]|uniref:Uncharacterized protein n=1 Tax=Dendrobium thyrsiflorum TaxID=117978 RepID=A0ABD0UFA1_DENTH
MGKHDMDQEDEETISFASMACHVPPSPETSRNPSPPGDPLFEFRPSPELSYPSSPADLLFSNGLLLPRSLPPETGQNDRPRCLKDPAGHRSGSRKLTMSASKRVSFQMVDAGSPPAITGKSIQQARNGGRHVRPVARRPGRKEAERRRGMFGFLKTACRECQACEPSSQVREMKPLQACSISSYNYNGQINRIARPTLITIQRGNSKK